MHCLCLFPYSLFRDETRPGHSLGEPAARVAAPERKLTILSVTLQRLLLHLAMLAGSLNNDLQVTFHVKFVISKVSLTTCF